VEPFIDLALQHQEVDLAISVTGKYDLELLPNWLLADLADVALSQHKIEFLDRMISQLGAGFLRQQPVLAARIAVARNDASSALRWIESAEREPKLSPNERIALADLYVSLGRKEDALRSYERSISTAGMPDYLFLEMAQLYVEQRKADRGLSLIEPIRNKHHSIEFEIAWALLATASGHAGQVLTWFNGAGSKKMDIQSLNDLYFTATEAAQPKLAVAIAERLYKQRRNRVDQAHLINALLAASRPDEALQYLRPLLSDTEGISKSDRTEEEEHTLPL